MKLVDGAKHQRPALQTRAYLAQLGHGPTSPAQRASFAVQVCCCCYFGILICSPQENCCLGTYGEQIARNSSKCILCRSGTFNMLSGANTSDACTKCAAGTFNPAPGGISPSNCSECALGSVSPDTGADHCIPCQTNTFPHPNRIICTPCQTLGCTGTPDCVVGYEGELCSVCSAGFFADATKGQSLYACSPCGAAPAWALVVLTIILLLIGVAFLKLNSSALFQKALVPLRSALTYFHGKSDVSKADLKTIQLH